MPHQPIDLASLNRLAHDLTDSAQRTRTATVGLRESGATLPWQSPAAHAFEGALSSFLVQLGQLAAALDDSAATVVEHGARAQRHADVLGAALGAVERLMLR